MKGKNMSASETPVILIHWRQVAFQGDIIVLIYIWLTDVAHPTSSNKILCLWIMRHKGSIFMLIYLVTKCSEFSMWQLLFANIVPCGAVHRIIKRLRGMLHGAWHSAAGLDFCYCLTRTYVIAGWHFVSDLWRFRLHHC